MENSIPVTPRDSQVKESELVVAGGSPTGSIEKHF